MCFKFFKLNCFFKDLIYSSKVCQTSDFYLIPNQYCMKKIIVAVFFLLGFNSFGQESTIVQPPYQAHSSNFMMALFHLKAIDVNKLLPAGVNVKQDEKGMVVATFEMYETDRIYGLENYKVAFIVVDIENYNSENGTTGHWAIWGSVDSKNAAINFNHHFGLPFEYESNMTVQKNDNIHLGSVGIVGKEKIKISIKKSIDKPFKGQGIVNMVGKTKKGIAKSEVPWLSEGWTGELLDWNVDPQGNRVLELIKNEKPFWSMISVEQVFSYSKPIIN